MSDLHTALAQIDADLRGLDLKWTLVGGFAIVTRTEPRLTRDVDVAVSVADDSQAEQCVSDLVARGYAIRQQLEQTAAQRLSSVRMACPTGTSSEILLDLLFASSGIEPEIVSRAESLEVLPDLFMPVATLGDLIALKVLADRPQDRIDLKNLLADATPQELDQAREAVQLIQYRGYSRERDVVQELETWISQRSALDLLDQARRNSDMSEDEATELAERENRRERGDRS